MTGSSRSTPTAWPAGPTRRASSRVTAPSPQPTSRQRIPSATPTRDSRASVVGPTTRPSKRSRSAPSTPPRSTYPIFGLRRRPGPRRPARLPSRPVVPLHQVVVRPFDQVLVSNVQRPAKFQGDLLRLDRTLPWPQHDLDLQERAEPLDLVQVDARRPGQEEPATLAYLAPHPQRLGEDFPQGRGLGGLA